mmetsp:Transcript_30358/g.71057  ORF Transcript_30358/g.71057 Transcript_30358/m.71057 type:complete len:243 (-) Transcript_30358:145-873(-)
MDLGILDELVLVNLLFDILHCGEVVMHPILLAVPRRPGRVADGEAKGIRILLHEFVDERSLADTRRAAEHHRAGLPLLAICTGMVGRRVEELRIAGRAARGGLDGLEGGVRDLFVVVVGGKQPGGTNGIRRTVTGNDRYGQLRHLLGRLEGIELAQGGDVVRGRRPQGNVGVGRRHRQHGAGHVDSGEFVCATFAVSTTADCNHRLLDGRRQLHCQLRLGLGGKAADSGGRDGEGIVLLAAL